MSLDHQQLLTVHYQLYMYTTHTLYIHTLYTMLDVLGHPFGKAPSPRPFEADLEESKVILSDPVNPLGKEVIAGEWESLYSELVSV